MSTYALPGVVLTAMGDPRLGLGLRVTLFALWLPVCRLNGPGDCPTVERSMSDLARSAGLAESSARTACKGLEQRGYITMTHRRVRVGEPGRERWLSLPSQHTLHGDFCRCATPLRKPDHPPTETGAGIHTPPVAREAEPIRAERRQERGDLRWGT